MVSDGDHPRRWAWADAWMLAAIMMVGKMGGGSLSDMAAAADAINQAILTESEVEPAVRRLLGANLIGTRQRRFFLTYAGRVIRPSSAADGSTRWTTCCGHCGGCHSMSGNGACSLANYARPPTPGVNAPNGCWPGIDGRGTSIRRRGAGSP